MAQPTTAINITIIQFMAIKLSIMPKPKHMYNQSNELFFSMKKKYMNIIWGISNIKEKIAT